MGRETKTQSTGSSCHRLCLPGFLGGIHQALSPSTVPDFLACSKFSLSHSILLIVLWLLFALTVALRLWRTQSASSGSRCSPSGKTALLATLADRITGLPVDSRSTPRLITSTVPRYRGSSPTPSRFGPFCLTGGGGHPAAQRPDSYVVAADLLIPSGRHDSVKPTPGSIYSAHHQYVARTVTYFWLHV